MLGYVIRRTLIGVVTVLIIVTIVFFLLRLIPGDLPISDSLSSSINSPLPERMAPMET